MSARPLERSVDVAVVGGGPAGAAAAIRLAQAGVETVVFERDAAPRWRACGVYSSPLTRARLASLGFEPRELDRLLQRVPALVVETLRGATCRLEYDDRGDACGADRVRLDAALLERAASAGAQVRTAASVKVVEPGAQGGAARLSVSESGTTATWRARMVIGADGPASLVARAFSVQRHARRLRRAGLTFHLDVSDAPPADAAMVIGPGWYCGICPVPGGRVNIGIVIGERALRRALSVGERPVSIARRILGQLPGSWSQLATREATDDIAVALPLANRVARRSGPGFLLVGDACGFIDPISGEGLHRALVSAALGAEAAVSALQNVRGPALAYYDRRLRKRFGRKDVISWMLQAFLARPEVLDYAVRRLGDRDLLRSTFASVMADLEPPERALGPRFLASLLRP